MNSKDEKQTGIPIAELLKGEDNKRNLRMFMREPHGDPRAREALIDELWRLRDEERRRAAPFRRGRARGSESEKKQHVRKLVTDNPGLGAKELRLRADESILDGMKDRRFSNLVSEVRPK